MVHSPVRQRLPRICTALLAIASAPGVTQAQWTVTYLGPVSTGSRAYGVNGEQQVGRIGTAGNTHASVWNGSSSAWVDLNPAGSSHSGAYSAFGGQQGGFAVFDGVYHAGMWSGSSASWVDLGGESQDSQVFAVFEGRQAGYKHITLTMGGVYHAGYWHGSAASWVDLAPPGATWSHAYGISADQQVGVATFGFGGEHAIVWNGTAASWVDLNPAGSAYSYAQGVSNGQQVGYANLGGEHAVLWTGTAASRVDLNPAGAEASRAYGVFAGWQVGQAELESGATHASLWHGTAASWEDLSLALAGSWGDTYARHIWSDASATYVVGYGFDNSTGQERALLWTRSVCSAPAIGTQPSPATAAPSATATFSVTAGGTGTLSYAWRHAGAPLSDLPGRITGSGTRSLTISSIVQADAGSYDCVVSNACGSVTTSTVSLTIASAVYVCVLIHGQLPLASCPPSLCPGALVRPDWMQVSRTRLTDAFTSINPHPGGTSPVTLKVVNGDWMEDTRSGFGDIIASRFYQLAALLVNDPGAAVAANRAADALEDTGRAATSSASRRAAYRIFGQVSGSIDAARGTSGTPVFVDLVAHSRGGPVAAEVLRHVQSKSIPSQPVYFSTTLLDAIDPDGGPVHQMLESAGDLLGDPVIDSALLPGRTTNFVAAQAAFAPPEETWFPGEFTSWAAARLAQAGFNWAAPAIGYPHGRARPVSQTMTLPGQVVPGTTHGSIADLFAATAGTFVANPQEFSFAFSTRIGQLLRNPTQPLGPLLTTRCDGCPFHNRSDPPVTEYVTDPTFAASCAAIASVQDSLASPEIAAMLIPDLHPVPAILAYIAANNWVADSSWIRAAGTASCVNNLAIVPTNECISQPLDPASLSESRVRIRVAGSVDAGGAALITLSGDGLAFSRVVQSAGAFLVDAIVTRSAPASSGSLDAVAVAGGTVRVSLISVGPGCRPDATGDGIVTVQDIFEFLNQWFSGAARADFNGSGAITVQDIFDFLNAWFAGCP